MKNVLRFVVLLNSWCILICIISRYYMCVWKEICFTQILFEFSEVPSLCYVCGSYSGGMESECKTASNTTLKFCKECWVGSRHPYMCVVHCSSNQSLPFSTCSLWLYLSLSLTLFVCLSLSLSMSLCCICPSLLHSLPPCLPPSCHLPLRFRNTSDYIYTSNR